MSPWVLPEPSRPLSGWLLTALTAEGPREQAGWDTYCQSPGHSGSPGRGCALSHSGSSHSHSALGWSRPQPRLWLGCSGSRVDPGLDSSQASCLTGAWATPQGPQWGCRGVASEGGRGPVSGLDVYPRCFSEKLRATSSWLLGSPQCRRKTHKTAPTWRP